MKSKKLFLFISMLLCVVSLDAMEHSMSDKEAATLQDAKCLSEFDSSWFSCNKDIFSLTKKIWITIACGKEKHELFDIVKLLLKCPSEHIDIDGPNSISKSTMLHHAAIRGFPIIVKLLLENGANKDLKNSDGETVLEFMLNNKELKDNNCLTNCEAHKLCIKYLNNNCSK